MVGWEFIARSRVDTMAPMTLIDGRSNSILYEVLAWMATYQMIMSLYPVFLVPNLVNSFMHPIILTLSPVNPNKGSSWGL